MNYKRVVPQTGLVYFVMEKVMKIGDLGKPIGIVVLEESKKIIVAESNRDRVNMMTDEGIY